MTTLSQPRRASVVYALRLCTHNSNAFPRPRQCCTCHLHGSRFSTAPLPNSYAKISGHQKEAACRRRSYDHVTATTTERSALTAIHASQSQPTPDFLMHAASFSHHMSSPSLGAKPRMQVTHAQAAIKRLMTPTLSWTISSKSRSAATGVVYESPALTSISMSLIIPLSTNASRTVLFESCRALQVRKPPRTSPQCRRKRYKSGSTACGAQRLGRTYTPAFPSSFHHTYRYIPTPLDVMFRLLTTNV